jgi:hypothetical protein
LLLGEFEGRLVESGVSDIRNSHKVFIAWQGAVVSIRYLCTGQSRLLLSSIQVST